MNFNEKTARFLLQIIVGLCKVIPGVDRAWLASALYEIADELELVAKDLEDK